MSLTDDQCYDDLSCHGNPRLETPEFDRLHNEAVRLTDFHANPMCAPTGAALMTLQRPKAANCRDPPLARKAPQAIPASSSS